MEYRFSPHLVTTHSSSDSHMKASASSKGPLAKIFQKYGQQNENFTTVIYDQKVLDEIEKIYHAFSYKKTFIHIGMGGSGLGPQMLIHALKNQGHGQNGPPREFHFLQNSDPESVVSVIDQCHLPETLFYVVSKSGTTIETMTILSLIMVKLQSNGIKKSQWKNYLVFCTGPQRGDLQAMAQELDILSLFIPEKVGGRFSVLTAVGLLPGRFANIHLQQLLTGAQMTVDLLKQGPPLIPMANTIIEHYHSTQKISQTVLMPYCQRLQCFNHWFVQLWAESLGKKGIGPTPIPAMGASDQHSQMQLFMDGPRDKFFIFIQVQKFTETGHIDRKLLPSSLQMLQEMSLSRLIQCQLQGTLQAMDDQKIPYALLAMKQLAEKELGQLIMFFELLTILVGETLQVNPFDQPGVERGKHYTLQLLGLTKGGPPEIN